MPNSEGPVPFVPEIVFKQDRVIDAPRELVFKLFTEREHLAHWWGPKGFALTIEKFEPKPGGVFLYKMAVPNGFEMWGKWIIREIAPPERLVFVSSFSDPEGGDGCHPMAPDWPKQTLCIYTFESQGTKTKLALEAFPINASQTERKTFEDGFESMNGGYSGMFDNLDAYLKTLG
ncbi:MAG: SRPBCC domain-containing protein [Candidatus Obscuribacterales bacterium]|nr:SRPBCC domain-containing protein [Candidatus Obscuribacterales bacterium]